MIYNITDIYIECHNIISFCYHIYNFLLRKIMYEALVKLELNTYEIVKLIFHCECGVHTLCKMCHRGGFP